MAGHLLVNRAVASASGLVVACVLGLTGCTSDPRQETEESPTVASTTPSAPRSTPDTGTPAPRSPSPAPTNARVTQRARAALARVAATRLVTRPGYEGEANTEVGGSWRGLPFRAYVVPSQLAVRGELRVVGRRPVGGQVVAVLQVQDGVVRYLRFRRGGDTWLLASLDPGRSQTDLERTASMTAALLR